MWESGKCKWMNMRHKMMRKKIDVMVMTMSALDHLFESSLMEGIMKIQILYIHIWQQQETSIEVKNHMQLLLIFAMLVQVVSTALDFSVLL